MWLVGTLLLAQTTDPIANGAGWAGAGLLGLVLGWLLLKHLPAKDAQMAEMLAAKDLLIKELLESKAEELAGQREVYLRDLQAERNTFAAAINKVCDEFRIEQRAERESCEVERKAERESSERNFSRLAQAVESLTRDSRAPKSILRQQPKPPEVEST